MRFNSWYEFFIFHQFKALTLMEKGHKMKRAQLDWTRLAFFKNSLGMSLSQIFTILNPIFQMALFSMNSHQIKLLRKSETIRSRRNQKY